MQCLANLSAKPGVSGIGVAAVVPGDDHRYCGHREREGRASRPSRVHTGRQTCSATLVTRSVRAARSSASELVGSEATTRRLNPLGERVVDDAVQSPAPGHRHVAGGGNPLRGERADGERVAGAEDGRQTVRCG